MPRIYAPTIGNRALPLIEVTVRLADLEVEIPALIDSGSSTTIVPGEIAGWHGLAFESLGDERVGTAAGGSMRVRTTSGWVRWLDTIFATSVAVAEPGRLPVALLGRDDFFRAFLICFAWNERRPFVEIDPAP